jgi:hypothetical protein
MHICYLEASRSCCSASPQAVPPHYPTPPHPTPASPNLTNNAQIAGATPAPPGAEVPTAYAADLEAASFPTVDDIMTVVKATLGK